MNLRRASVAVPLALAASFAFTGQAFADTHTYTQGTYYTVRVSNTQLCITDQEADGRRVVVHATTGQTAWMVTDLNGANNGYTCEDISVASGQTVTLDSWRQNGEDVSTYDQYRHKSVTL
ncbi:hypothetical protein [Streptomyces daliensis]